MKNKALELIDEGFSAKTLRSLTEPQLNVLHSKIMNEQAQPIKTTKTIQQIVLPSGSQTTVGGVSVSNVGGKTTVTPTTETEVKEDEDLDITKDPDATDDGMGIFEKDEKSNPWAICTAQLGKEFGTRERHLWSAKEKNKYERCVKDVKKSLKEGKKPVSLFLENQIMKLVERNLPPRITKGDLVKYLSEAPATAPSKPKTSPTTKPGKPATRPQKPAHPLRNPNPGEKESPKAINPERAKDEVISAIMKILKNG
jgi:hypothetical protein